MICAEIYKKSKIISYVRDGGADKHRYQRIISPLIIITDEYKVPPKGRCHRLARELKDAITIWCKKVLCFFDNLTMEMQNHKH
mgnify:CR=1 FL=1